MQTRNHERFCLTRRALVGAIALTLPAVRALAAPERASCTVRLGGNGDPVSLEKFHGKILYLDFWASWCTPCLLSFPFMNQLQRSYANRGLEILAVNMDEKPSDAQRFLADHPASFPVAIGPNVSCARNLAVATMPTSFLIDRNGQVRATHVGFRSGDVGTLRGALEQLLSEA